MFDTQPKNVALLVFAVFLGDFTTATAQPSLPPLQGVPEAPVRNSVTDENNESVPALHTDSEVCPGETIFRRGDVDADGVFNISDPIFLLSCLFLGTACPTCSDAADSNDDGTLDIADGTFLLSWPFLGGAQPPPPFPGCGLDLTSDALGNCIFDSKACF